MFKDAKEELERLSRQLLEEEEYEEDEEEAEEAEEEEEYDATEEEPEALTQPEPEPRRNGWGLVAAILLLTAGVVLLLAYAMAKRGGLL